MFILYHSINDTNIAHFTNEKNELQRFLPEIPELVNRRAGIQTQVCLTPKLEL